MMLHGPKQSHPAFDLAVVEHHARRWDLHRRATRALVDERDRARIGEVVERLAEGQRPVALALRDGEEARFGAGCGMGVNGAPVGDDEPLRFQRLQPDVIRPAGDGALDPRIE
jgi:hypothetical protein